MNKPYVIDTPLDVATPPPCRREVGREVTEGEAAKLLPHDTGDDRECRCTSVQNPGDHDHYRCTDCGVELERVYVFVKKDVKKGISVWHPVHGGTWCGPMEALDRVAS